ncbi:hypothetical protein ADUPG1_009797 [Aduncisulcus paluster]|uniref:CS domain-containing protein n=1 Tax=Aduncisulcus paluster TaxID=2918883 RepID=A0ABQ5KY06_9EUKA|nr:hypothetical protein ADUPG1_009797 [Aduncisulcus paluster]
MVSPNVFWAQHLSDVTLEVVEKKMKFTGKSGEKEYSFELELYADVDMEKSGKKVLGRCVEIKLIKAEEKWWPRLTATRFKAPWLKIDWNKWVDEDEEHPKKDDFGAGYEGLGGMPGMPGMGGMPGGMPNMADMMGGMGGMGGAGMPNMADMMGGMGGMPGMGGAGMPSMEELMKQMGGADGMPNMEELAKMAELGKEDDGAIEGLEEEEADLTDEAKKRLEDMDKKDVSKSNSDLLDHYEEEEDSYEYEEVEEESESKEMIPHQPLFDESGIAPSKIDIKRQTSAMRRLTPFFPKSKRTVSSTSVAPLHSFSSSPSSFKRGKLRKSDKPQHRPSTSGHLPRVGVSSNGIPSSPIPRSITQRQTSAMRRLTPFFPKSKRTVSSTSVAPLHSFSSSPSSFKRGKLRKSDKPQHRPSTSGHLPRVGVSSNGIPSSPIPRSITQRSSRSRGSVNLLKHSQHDLVASPSTPPHRRASTGLIPSSPPSAHPAHPSYYPTLSPTQRKQVQKQSKTLAEHGGLSDRVFDTIRSVVLDYDPLADDPEVVYAKKGTTGEIAARIHAEMRLREPDRESSEWVQGNLKWNHVREDLDKNKPVERVSSSMSTISSRSGHRHPRPKKHDSDEGDEVFFFGPVLSPTKKEGIKENGNDILLSREKPPRSSVFSEDVSERILRKSYLKQKRLEEEEALKAGGKEALEELRRKRKEEIKAQSVAETSASGKKIRRKRVKKVIKKHKDGTIVEKTTLPPSSSSPLGDPLDTSLPHPMIPASIDDMPNRMLPSAHPPSSGQTSRAGTGNGASSAASNPQNTYGYYSGRLSGNVSSVAAELAANTSVLMSRTGSRGSDIAQAGYITHTPIHKPKIKRGLRGLSRIPLLHTPTPARPPAPTPSKTSGKVDDPPEKKEPRDGEEIVPSTAMTISSTLNHHRHEEEDVDRSAIAPVNSDTPNIMTGDDVTVVQGYGKLLRESLTEPRADPMKTEFGTPPISKQVKQAHLKVVETDYSFGPALSSPKRSKKRLTLLDRVERELQRK